MMRPTIDQLLEYVRGGETDSSVKDMLRFDPEGPEKLKEARFICAMIARRDRPDTTRGPSLDSDESFVASSREFSVRSRPMLNASQMPFEHMPPMSGAEQIPVIERLVSDLAASPRTLGTLTALDRDNHLHFSFEPDELPTGGLSANEELVMDELKTYYEPATASSMAHEQRRDAIRIEGSDFTISLTDKLLPGKPLMLRFARTRSDSPIHGLELIFMPKDGPFHRMATNLKGVAKLPRLQTGVLRISRKPVQQLYIAEKK